MTLYNAANSWNNNVIHSQFEDDEMKEEYELSLDEYIKEIVAYEPIDNCTEEFKLF